MTDVRNANDFSHCLRTIQDRYTEQFGPRIRQIRQQFGSVPKEELDFILEAHARAYFVNRFLEALNWRIDQETEEGLPPLIPEAPIRSSQKASIRYLDYLGLDRSTETPLLIVETKRPSALLPRIFQSTTTYQEVICKGLAGEKLTDEWNEWLTTLADYSNSVMEKSTAPLRVVITNGSWLILFLDPASTFSNKNEAEPEGILVYENFEEMDRRSTELFENLEYFKLSRETRAFAIGELLFNFEKTDITELMHGLRLRYSEPEGVYERSPSICVAPVLFFRIRTGAWFRVEGPKQFVLPHENESLSKHLSDVKKQASLLLSDIRERLEVQLIPKSVEAHYLDANGFNQLKGLSELSRNNYLVVTGEDTHYLREQPTVIECPFHEWGFANQNGCSSAGPIVARSVAPRSFFLSGEIHHCAHREVITAKSSQITKNNMERLGARSGSLGQAFCEIWSFDEHLCCRTCVFEQVCTKSDSFKLPCVGTKASNTQ